MKRALCLMLCAAALLALCACGRQAAASSPVVLWSAADDPLLPALRQAAEDYKRGKRSGSAALVLREFEDEDALRNALNTAQPDLLLCSHTLAFPLFERGLLSGSGPAVAYPETVADRCAGVGRSVYPLGSRVQILASREDLSGGLPALCAAAAAWGETNRQPFLAADSYTDLLCQAVLGSGEFHADREKDCFNAAFREAWNALAECAFAGGLYVGGESAAAALNSGLPAAVVFADTIAQEPPEGCMLSMLTPEGTPVLSDLRCLALTAREGRALHGASSFLTWLFSGERPARLALESGLIPALPGGEAADSLTELLLSLRERTLWLADGECDYVKNRAAFEAAFRTAMDLLK